MTLNEYIQSLGLRHEDAAQQIGISRSYLTEIVSGAKAPGRNTIAKINIWSGGSLPPSIWFAEQQEALQKGEV